MKLIAGLGNPGRAYIDSRHNVGFSVIKSLVKFHKASFTKDGRAFSLSARFKLQDYEVIAAMPLTFMNLSGVALSALVKKYKVKLDDLLVVCDDIDLEFGRLKIRPRGSSGGHNGLKSIIDNLGSDRFNRLRIGIGRPKASVDAVDYVLSPFNRQEHKVMPDILERAVECCQIWVTRGITKSMNIFNKRSEARNE